MLFLSMPATLFTFCTYFFLQSHWMGWLISSWHASKRGNEIWFCTQRSSSKKLNSALEMIAAGGLRLIYFLKPAQQKFQSFRWNISCYFNVTFPSCQFSNCYYMCNDGIHYQDSLLLCYIGSVKEFYRLVKAHRWDLGALE